MNTKCSSCPMAQGKPCLGQSTHAMYCEWAATGDKLRIRHIKATSDPENPPPAPSFPERAANFLGAAIDHINSGRPTVPHDVYVARMDACKACEHYEGRACRLCGCNMPLKASWAEQACPIGKWAAFEGMETVLAP